MSHHHSSKDYYIAINPYILISLILIVLQWFSDKGAGGPFENLTSNGGLFMVSLFILIYCSNKT